MSYFKVEEIKDLVKAALREDIGSRDITTELLIPKNKTVRAVLLAKEPGVICGLGVAALVFKSQDEGIKFKSLVREGYSVKKGKVIARVYGKAKSILSAERVALNFLTHLSGISTQTRKFVERVKPYKVKIMDTRKTTPGLRILQKYAVRIGGGYNHRLSLDEMVIVKDNHIKAIGDRLWVIGHKAKQEFYGTEMEIEVNNLREFKQALKIKPDIIMFDNMSIGEMKAAVKIRNNLSPTTSHPSPKLEASGGITLKNVRKIAACGVEMISIGELTHSVDSVDISLETA